MTQWRERAMVAMLILGTLAFWGAVIAWALRYFGVLHT